MAEPSRLVHNSLLPVYSHVAYVVPSVSLGCLGITRVGSGTETDETTITDRQGGKLVSARDNAPGEDGVSAA